ncbi:hypothetical protein DXG01_007030, partial [Tephrocybe rancida]
MSTLTLSSSTLNEQNKVPMALSTLSATLSSSMLNELKMLSETTVSLPLLMTSSSTLSTQEKDVLMALSKTIGLLPPLPPSLDSLDTFSAQLPLLPSSGIGLSGSTVPSQAKRPHNGKKSNPFVDLKAEEDIRDNADILDTEADNDFSVHFLLRNVSTYVNIYLDDFIDDREVFTDEEQPTKTPLPDKAPGEVDEHLEVDKDL